MICKFCGMDSVTPGVCSWCGKSLAEAPASTRKVAPGLPMPSRPRGPVPAVPLPSTRAPLPSSSPAPSNVLSSSVSPTGSESTVASGNASGDFASSGVPLLGGGEVPFAPAVKTSAIVAAPSLLPQTEGSVEAAVADSPARDFNRRDYSTRVLQEDPQGASAGVPSDVPFEMTIGTGVSPPRGTTPLAQVPAIDARQRKAAVDAALADSEPASKMLLLRYASVFALILMVTGALSFIGKQLYVVPMVIAMFLSALLLPVMRVTPWADEDADDLIWFVLLTLLFGPLVALIIYSFVSLMRQSCNVSILGCFVVAALVRITAEVASGGVTVSNLFAMTSPFTSLNHIDANMGRTLLLNWSGFTALIGWYAASTFHKEDE